MGNSASSIKKPKKSASSSTRADAGPLADGKMKALPAFKEVRVGDRYHQSFEAVAKQSGVAYDVKTLGDSVGIGPHEVKARRWSAPVEGEVPGTTVIRVTHGSELGTAIVTVGAPELGPISTSRIHRTAKPFEDPNARTLYPGDDLKLRTTLDIGKHTFLDAKLADTNGLLSTIASRIDGQQVELRARAQSPGASLASFVLTNRSREVVRLPVHMIEVVPPRGAIGGSNADELKANEESDGSRVQGRSLDDALSLLALQFETLLAAQSAGVKIGKGILLRRPVKQPVPWYANLFGLAVEIAISFMTAGLGNAVGAAVARWKPGIDVSKFPLFDFKAAISTSVRDTLKKSANALLVSKSSKAESSVTEEWAVDLFCDSQIEAMSEKNLNSKGQLINGFQTYRDLEISRPGLGFAAIEAHRHALASQYDLAREQAFQTTLREWLRALSEATHGTTTSARGKGSNLGVDGRGDITIVVGIDPRKPLTPVAIRSARLPLHFRLKDHERERFLAQGGRLADLGIPFVVEAPRAWVLGRNQAGDMFIRSINAATPPGDYGGTPGTEYLVRKGADSEQLPASFEDRKSAHHAGARKIVDIEVGQADIRTLPYGGYE
jgi:hypothetical protein